MKKKFSTEGKILNWRENAQLSRKFSTEAKNLNSGENSHLKRKFSTEGKILNWRENPQLMRKYSAEGKINNSGKICQLRKNLLFQAKRIGQRKSEKQWWYVKSFVDKYSSKFSSPQTTLIIYKKEVCFSLEISLIGLICFQNNFLRLFKVLKYIADQFWQILSKNFSVSLKFVKSSPCLPISPIDFLFCVLILSS